ncbi:acyl-CoA thioesterase [Sediminibacterium roseum]|uniref:Acyl-CoA thioesterase n=1 Tax=Sediminibacterium roseum TaxID=1978412 RepID=A0ABW9ZSZ3_9BACT|nr:thioesterase family protein [Sediminibacterium roseum]NCI50253.1 acyl-CoA thioesterase [Sediminibacterium roseum]
MYEHITKIRVRYADTDQMNIVYYGNYAEYFEVGRTECIRDLGFTYKEMEQMGVHMPVVAMEARFLRPARYDDLISVKTILKELPDDHEVSFFQEVYNENNKLLTTGKVTLYFMDSATGKKSRMPEALREKLTSYFV